MVSSPQAKRSSWLSVPDYCDSHKSKQWQPYSSAIAAAFGKELLSKIPSNAVEKLPQLVDLVAMVLNVADHYQKDPISTEKHTKCLDTLKCIHPRFDRLRLEDTKGGLLKDVYRWILDTEEYKTWLSNQGLLWIKGDPGKGKTMLTCGIINELGENTAYFFCQATIDTNNTATHVLRGLLFAILEKNPSLSEGVRDKLERASSLPERNAFYILQEVMEDLLTIHETTIMIDALDECLIGLDRLLRFILKVSAFYNSKWLVTSRNIADIYEALGETSQISLEFNDLSVTEAVNTFIDYKVQILSRVKKYDKTLQAFVLQHLKDNAKGTFLWISLVCINLSKVRPRHTREALLEYPSGLESLYERMLDYVKASIDAHKLKEILAIICVVLRPISLEELSTLIYPAEDRQNISWIEDMVNDCGSFLTIQDSVVQFVHQSAKDFLTLKQRRYTFPDSEMSTHQHVFAKSLECLQPLHRNMYGLREPGMGIDKIVVPRPDPLAGMKYAAVYWIDHLLYSLNPAFGTSLSLADAVLISNFFRKKYLYWLEALSLLESIYPVALSMSKLAAHLKPPTNLDASLKEIYRIASHILEDALHFVRFFQYALNRFPLQVYISGLLFSPKQSLIRLYFQHEAPKWVTLKKGLQEIWPASLTLDVATVSRLRWSSDGRYLATHGYDHNLRIWEANSGQLLSVLPIHACDFVYHKDTSAIMVLCGLFDFLEVWSVTTGQLLNEIYLDSPRFQVSTKSDSTGPISKNHPRRRSADHLREHRGSHTPIAFSKDVSLVARSRYGGNILEVNKTKSGHFVQSFVCPSPLEALAFCSNNLQIAWADRKSIHICNVDSGNLMWITEFEETIHMAFSPCSELIAISNQELEIWEWQKSQRLNRLHAVPSCSYKMQYRAMAFHPTSSKIFVSHSTALQEWDGREQILYATFGHFQDTVVSIAPSEDGKSIAATDLTTVKIWKLDKYVELQAKKDKIDNDLELINLTAHGETYFALMNGESSGLLKWDATVGSEQSTVLRSDILYMTWEPSLDKSRAALFDWDGGNIEVWDLVEGVVTMALRSSDPIAGISWGPDEFQITVWDRNSPCMSSLDSRGGEIVEQWPAPDDAFDKKLGYSCLRWSPIKTHLALSSNFGLGLWNIKTRTWITLTTTTDDVPLHRDSMQFSTTGTLFAHLGWRTKMLQVFNVDTQDLILNIPDQGFSPILSMDQYWLETDKAFYSLTTEGGLSESNTFVSRPATHLNIDRDPGREELWLRSGLDNIIWLPPEYRPVVKGCFIQSSKVAMLIGQGQLVILDIHWDRSKDFDSQVSELRSML